VNTNPNPQTERALSFTLADIQRQLGSTITDASIVKVLDRYGYSYEKTEEYYTLAVSLWRHDITGAHDMAEEIGRVIGYDTIPNAVLPFTPTIVANEQYEKIRVIKFALSQQGYSEVMTYSFRKKGEVNISYGPKDKSALRSNLSDALKESYDMNRLNAPLLGLQDVKIFEIGTVFMNDKEEMHVATADKSGVKEWTVEEYSEVAAGSVAVGNTAAITPFKPWSLYPFITRDIAVWLDNSEQLPVLQKIIADFAAKNCTRPATLFDMEKQAWHII